MSDAPDLAAVRELLREAGEPDPGELAAHPIPGGASRDLWAVVGEDRGPAYVLRRDPPGETPQTSRAAEFAVQQAAFDAGVRVPRPIACEPDGGRLGTAGMVMAWVEGEAIPRKVLRAPALADARDRLPDELARALAALRAVDPAPLVPNVPEDPVEGALRDVRSQLDATEAAHPTLELGLRWLTLHRPEAVAPRVVHGDFRLGNFLVGPEGLQAVIDWEFWHVGDPLEDLAWVCTRPWRFGADDRVVAGVGDLDALLGGYGDDVPPERLRWWMVLMQVRWGTYCAQQAALRRAGAHASLERTVLARRVAEAEWDMLDLMETAR